VYPPSSGPTTGRAATPAVSSVLRRAPGERSHLRWWRRAGLVVVVAGSLVAGACGNGDESPPAATPDVAGDPEAFVEPCLPPACGTTVPYTAVDGYTGPEFATPASGATVDGATVVSATSGTWWAQGLVVNGTETLGAAPMVRAELVAADGSVIERVVGAALVGPLRPGEPSPFRVTSSAVQATDVSFVRWSVLSGTDVTDEVGRQVQMSVFWTRPAGGQGVDIAGYTDAGGDGSPLLVYVGVTNASAQAITRPVVVAAWVDGKGRVLAVTSAPVLLAGTATPAAELAGGAQADALVRLDPPEGDLLGDRQPLLWGISR
jgi:hypothetical protein